MVKRLGFLLMMATAGLAVAGGSTESPASGGGCGGTGKVKCPEGAYCLPKYKHKDSEGTCVKSGASAEPK